MVDAKVARTLCIEALEEHANFGTDYDTDLNAAAKALRDGSLILVWREDLQEIKAGLDAAFNTAGGSLSIATPIRQLRSLLHDDSAHGPEPPAGGNDGSPILPLLQRESIVERASHNLNERLAKECRHGNLPATCPAPEGC